LGEYLLINNTAGTATGMTTSDVAIQGGSANNIKPSSYNAFEIIVNIELITDVAPAEQTITYKIKLGSATLYSVDITPPSVASLTAATYPVTLHYVSGYVNGQEVGNAIGAGGALTVTQVSTATDVDVTSEVKSIYVKGYD
jgi:hypothetical protein